MALIQARIDAYALIEVFFLRTIIPNDFSLVGKIRIIRCKGTRIT
jgi:hypothetical protein